VSPSKKKAPVLRALKKPELARLDKWRGLGAHMLDYYLGKAAKPTPAILEKAFARWRDDYREKVRNVDLACALGTLYGDILAAKLDFDWRMRIDAHGEAYALYSPFGWETYPIDYVWKRVAPKYLGDESGFFSGGWEFWAGKIPRRKQGRASKPKKKSSRKR
jgi:hypothetical protein